VCGGGGGFPVHSHYSVVFVWGFGVLFLSCVCVSGVLFSVGVCVCDLLFFLHSSCSLCCRSSVSTS